MKLYALTLPNTLDVESHGFSDTVAICYAKSREEALAKFERDYIGITKQDVHKVWFNVDGVAVLTAY